MIDTVVAPTGDAVLDLLPRLAAALDDNGPALRPVARNTAPQPEPDDIDGLALVVLTSGSTGTPKQVLLTAAALRHSAAAGQSRLHAGDPGHWLLTLPVHHIAGLNVLLRAVVAGRAPVVLDTAAPFTPAAFAAATERLPPGPAFVSLVPTQLHRLLTDPAGTAALQRFTAVLVGGAATAGSLLAAARGAGVAVVTSYGMSETAGGCVYDGRPLDSVTATLDGAGRIVLAGPVVAAGYAGQPFDGPSFTTNDLGTWTDGRLVVLGRADDVLITGGVNVVPQSVEDALVGATGVDQVVITGVPDPEWGVRLVAVVVADVDGPPQLADLRTRAVAALGPAAAPKDLLVVDAVPTLPSGKVDRAAVAALARRGPHPVSVGDQPAVSPGRWSLPVSMLDEDPAELLAWGRSVLADRGYRVMPDEPQVRRRAWSTVARLQTDRGPVWVKGNARDFGVEAALLVLLTRYTPGHVLPLIGVDPARGRLITVDGGPTVSATGPGTEDEWIELVAGYAEVQVTMAPHAGELLRIGLPDMTPPRLTTWYRTALDRIRAEPGLSAGINGDRWAELDAAVPLTAALAAELDGDPTPVTVEHLDLHRNNVFAPDPAAGLGLRIFDWADAAVTHPFIALGRTLRVAAAGPDTDVTAVKAAPIRLDRLRDAYLRRWTPTGEIAPWMRRSAAVAEALALVATAGSRLRMSLSTHPERARAFVELLTDYARLAATLDADREPDPDGTCLTAGPDGRN